MPPKEPGSERVGDLELGLVLEKVQRVIVVPVVFADGLSSRASAVRRVHRVDDAHLSPADDRRVAVDGDGDRRRLQVEVLEVVGHGLVVPAQLARRRVEVHGTVGVEQRRRVLSIADASV